MLGAIPRLRVMLRWFHRRCFAGALRFTALLASAIFLVGWPVASVRLVNGITGSMLAAISPAAVLVRVGLFAVLTALPLAWWNWRLGSHRRLWAACVAQLGVATGVSILLATLLVGERELLFTATSGAVLFGAYVEEVVFRALLPSYLGQVISGRDRISGRAYVVSVVLAQLSFAFCHTGATTVEALGASTPRLARLFFGGLLYSELFSTMGLGFATAVHASLNLELVDSPRRFGYSAGLTEVVVWGVVGLACVTLQGVAPRRRSDSPAHSVPLH